MLDLIRRSAGAGAGEAADQVLHLREGLVRVFDDQDVGSDALNSLLDGFEAGAEDCSERGAAVGEDDGGGGRLDEENGAGGAGGFYLGGGVLDCFDHIGGFGGEVDWGEWGFFGL